MKFKTTTYTRHLCSFRQAIHPDRLRPERVWSIPGRKTHNLNSPVSHCVFCNSWNRLSFHRPYRLPRRPGPSQIREGRAAHRNPG